MMSEVEERPRFVTGGYVLHRSQWVKFFSNVTGQNSTNEVNEGGKFLNGTMVLRRWGVLQDNNWFYQLG